MIDGTREERAAERIRRMKAWQGMDNDERLIAIAAIDDWKHVGDNALCGFPMFVNKHYPDDDPQQVADYLHDLNAIYAIGLDEDEEGEVLSALEWVTGGGSYDCNEPCVAFACAEDRCEAMYIALAERIERCSLCT